MSINSPAAVRNSARPRSGSPSSLLGVSWAALKSTVRSGLLAAAAVTGACASTQYGASDANLSKARVASSEGASLFEHNCAGCHGERGEGGGRAPRVLGEGALPEFPAERDVNADPAAGDPELLRLRAQTRPAGAPSRDPFRTADDLYRYVSKNMPLPAQKAGSLSSEQYWALVNFMLLAQGVALPAEGVTPRNASSLKL
jgi:mono/diheme cytochrome c family protein